MFLMCIRRFVHIHSSDRQSSSSPWFPFGAKAYQWQCSLNVNLYIDMETPYAAPAFSQSLTHSFMPLKLIKRNTLWSPGNRWTCCGTRKHQFLLIEQGLYDEQGGTVEMAVATWILSTSSVHHHLRLLLRFFLLLATKIEIFPEAVECGVVADVAAVPHSFTAIHRKFYIHGDRNYLKLPEGKGFFSNLM